MAAGSFTTDVTAIRKRARQKMDEDFLVDQEEHADDIVDLLGA